MKGVESLLKRLCEVFINTSPGQLAELRSMLESGDILAVQKIAHSIKGGAGTIEAFAVHEAAYSLELAARDKNLDNAKARLSDLEDAVHRTNQIILERYPDISA
jgi:hypothetical protein